MKTIKNISNCAVVGLLIIGPNASGMQIQEGMNLKECTGQLVLSQDSFSAPHYSKGNSSTTFPEGHPLKMHRGYPSDSVEPYNNIVLKVVDKNNVSSSITTTIPTRYLFGCNDGSLVKIHYKGMPNRSISNMYHIDAECRKNPDFLGKSFQEQFEKGYQEFLADPMIYQKDLLGDDTIPTEMIKNGCMLPDGSHGPNGYADEATFRQKMMYQRSKGVLGKPGSNLALSLMNRQVGR